MTIYMSIAPKKSLGQHFLTDGNTIRKIAGSLSPAPGDAIVEIGPGTGALTGPLLQQHPQLQVIEIDSRAVAFLSAKWPELRIHQQDVLQTRWDQPEMLGESGKISLIGNLPYYITSPILFSVLDNRHLFREAVFMMQKEVAERLVARPRTKDYGILSVQTQLFARVEYLFTVSRHVFNPPPNVESAVVKLHFDGPAPGAERDRLKVVIRTAFGQRRKTLQNSLKPILFDRFPAEADRAAFSAEFRLTRRAEELTPDEFVALTNALSG
jgi:16S rRNA (adenine1518-N6/adenine1519-N6)-dimethyltransferase